MWPGTVPELVPLAFQDQLALCHPGTEPGCLGLFAGCQSLPETWTRQSPTQGAENTGPLSLGPSPPAPAGSATPQSCCAPPSPLVLGAGSGRWRGDAADK